MMTWEKNLKGCCSELFYEVLYQLSPEVKQETHEKISMIIASLPV
jgi:hypothetical protein